MTEPAHVLVINVHFAPYTYGGATVVAEEVALCLARNHGWQVSAISAVSRGDLADYTVIRTESRGMSSYLVNLPPRRDALQAFHNPKVAERILRLIREIKPTVVHIHCLQGIGADCLSRIRATGLPVILSIHDFWWICERQFMITAQGAYCGQTAVSAEGCRGCSGDFDLTQSRMAFLREQASAATVVTYPSEFARTLCEASGIAADRGRVWQNGVRLPEPDFFERQRLRRAENPQVVFGFVGGPSQIKGWPLVRTAFQQLGRTDLRGIVVDATQDGSWWRPADLQGLPGKWSIWPRFDQAGMDRFYSAIDVLLFPSQWKETFGLAIREALARGIHVLQTNSGGTIEHSRAKQTALLEIGEGPARLADIIRNTLDARSGFPDPILVRSYAEQAAEFLTFLPTTMTAAA